jgi:hypothetical protein
MNGRSQPVFGHGPELRIAETGKTGGVILVGWLQNRHTRLQVSEGRKPAFAGLSPDTLASSKRG